MIDRCLYFCFLRGGWVPTVLTWDRETGLFMRVEGPDAFTTWGRAAEASRFPRVDGDADG